MPSPKSGNAPAAVTPAEPKEAYEADDADPGSMDEVVARQKETKTGKHGDPAGSAAAHNPNSEENKEKKSWIELELVYESNGKPVSGAAYEVTLPDGTTSSGTTNEKGLGRVEKFDPGTCRISFTRLDKEAWEDASG